MYIRDGKAIIGFRGGGVSLEISIKLKLLFDLWMVDGGCRFNLC